MEELKCDMSIDCKKGITYIDKKGYVYCEQHGMQRKTNGTPCRILRSVEVKKLQEGKTISYR